MTVTTGAAGDHVFDPQFLEMYTGGDAVIRNQVLELFLSQATQLLAKLEGARGNAKSWRETAHSLKGCAAGVGAVMMAEIAALAEESAGEAGEIQARYLHELNRAMDSTALRVRAVLAAA